MRDTHFSAESSARIRKRVSRKGCGFSDGGWNASFGIEVYLHNYCFWNTFVFIKGCDSRDEIIMRNFNGKASRVGILKVIWNVYFLKMISI